MRTRPPVLVLVPWLLMACATEPPTQPLDLEPSFEISDAQFGNGGSDHFYWLPPMVPNPTTSGTFIGILSPAVEICRLDTDDPPNCAGPSVRSFSPASGVEVDVHGPHYQVNWNTKEPADDGGEIVPGDYRITVMLEGRHLGHADVSIDTNAREFRSLASSQVIGLIDGSTLPIKFRIEYGVLDMFDIAYHSRAGADPPSPFNSDVFLYSRGSGTSVNLTNSPRTMDATPSWSPDGTRIAFASNRDNSGGEPDVYVMDLTDGSVQRLTTDGGWKPAWSPDGAMIAFQRGWPPICPESDPESPVCRQHDIWVMQADGTNQTQLTDVGHPVGEDPYEDHDPTWNMVPFQQPAVTFARSGNAPYDGCPDGYLSAGPLSTCDFDIVSKAVGRDWAHNHTRNPELDQTSPAWRHDGGGFLYSATPSANEDDPIELWVRVFGAGPDLMLTSSEPGWVNTAADWSWDNAEILVTRTSEAGYVGLWTLTPDGSGLSELLPGGEWGRYRPPLQ